MRIINRKTNPTMVELIIGIAFYGIIVGMILTGLYISGVPIEKFFHDGVVDIFIGYVVGILYSVGVTIYMARTLEDAIGMAAGNATKHVRIGYAKRVICLIAIYVFMLFTKFGSVIAMLIGLLSLKLSAYMQPITHKFLKKN